MASSLRGFARHRLLFFVKNRSVLQPALSPRSKAVSIPPAIDSCAPMRGPSRGVAIFFLLLPGIDAYYKNLPLKFKNQDYQKSVRQKEEIGRRVDVGDVGGWN